jgi:phosphatidylserine decarboxylase
MRIHREGTGSIFFVAILFLLAIIAIHYVTALFIFKILVLVPFAVVFILILWFFRIPRRMPVHDEKVVIAPADGKIVVIEKVVEEEYFKNERIQISIFMSPLNVHQNVYPIDGEVTYTAYHKGDYLVAWHPKSSTLNERATIVIKNKQGTEILVRQIAGAVARRICTYAKKGNSALQGSELGFIKFGSRVDVFLPVSSKIVCQINQKAVNKKTILAEIL